MKRRNDQFASTQKARMHVIMVQKCPRGKERKIIMQIHMT